MNTKKVKEQCIEVYDNALGNVSLTCKKLKISRYTFYEWKKKDEEFCKKINEIDESHIDFAETVLKKKIKDGSTPELIFYLKTKGKSRGYVEQNNLDLTTNGEKLTRIEVEIIKNKGD
jgi:hypothetical protein